MRRTGEQAGGLDASATRVPRAGNLARRCTAVVEPRRQDFRLSLRHTLESFRECKAQGNTCASQPDTQAPTIQLCKIGDIDSQGSPVALRPIMCSSKSGDQMHPVYTLSSEPYSLQPAIYTLHSLPSSLSVPAPRFSK